MIQKVMQYMIPLFVLGSGFIFSFPLGVIIYWFTSNLWTMAQQFYIYRFHPHKPAEKAAEPTNELGRSLAPAPGAKPVRKRSATSSVTPDRAGSADATPSSGPAAGPASADATPPPVRSTKPKPGGRPAGNRPANKRSGQRSKRR
jgi:YidC/Oxa1 family membrane protein insertase